MGCRRCLRPRRHTGKLEYLRTDAVRRSRKRQGVWRNGGVAGRRSAGLGSEGAARQVSHAVGVRAWFRHTDAVRCSRKGQGVWRNRVCKTLVHTRLFTTMQRYIFSGYGEGRFASSASSIRPCRRHEIPITPHQATSGSAVWGCGWCARQRVGDTLLCPPGPNAQAHSCGHGAVCVLADTPL